MLSLGCYGAHIFSSHSSLRETLLLGVLSGVLRVFYFAFKPALSLLRIVKPGEILDLYSITRQLASDYFK